VSQSTSPYAGINLTVDGWRIFPDRERRAFHVVVSDSRFSHQSAQEGLRFVAEASPLSANYNPREFNRILGAFHEQGQLTDWQEIPEHERHIVRRTQLIIDYLRNGGSW
jgi:hypothetical protein